MVKKTSTENSESHEESQEFVSLDSSLTLSHCVFEDETKNQIEFLQKQGEKKLLEGKIQGLQFFELAENLDPKDHELLHRQGIALLQFGKQHEKKKYVKLANKKFKSVLSVNKSFIESWQSWGDALFFLGKLENDPQFFYLAKDKYEEALSLAAHGTCKDFGNLHWQYGKILHKIAKHSEELSDLNTALQMFTKASTLLHNPCTAFWNDFGRTAFSMGKHMHDTRLYLKAIHCYKQSIQRSLAHFESWFYLADALSHLYKVTQDEDHFCQANECFANAAKLDPKSDFCWKQWAELLFHSGTQLKNKKRLFAALEKCHRSYSCDQGNIDTIILWSQIFSTLGQFEERLDLIYEGNNKICQALELTEKTPEICLSSGINLFAFGEYYNDVDYFYQAIEKFQEGLSINRTYHKLWYELGKTYSHVAQKELDVSLYEKAEKFFQKAIHLHAASDYYFQYANCLTKVAECHNDKNVLSNALIHYEQAFLLRKNTTYMQAGWLYQYAEALDLMGDLSDEEHYYVKAIEVLQRVLLLEPDYPNIHYKLALVYSHQGELAQSEESFQKSITHFKMAFQINQENEFLITDWALTLINLADLSSISLEEKEDLLQGAEYKLIQSAKLGNTEIYYHLAALYSLMQQCEKSMYFLEKAEVTKTLPSLEEILEDDWLENLRKTGMFRDFIQNLQNIDESYSSER